MSRGAQGGPPEAAPGAAAPPADGSEAAPGVDAPPAEESRPAPAWPWLAALALVLLGVALIRWRLLDAPLERDEGEYAYGGQLLRRGMLPYVELYNMKLPGIYAAYAAILTLFGETTRGIHLGLLLVNAGTGLGLFLLGRRLLGSAAGLAAAAAFAVLSLGRSVQGLYANAEHFVLLPAVLGVLLLVRALESGKRRELYGAGVLLGAAFLVKQHGLAFCAFGGVYLLLVRLRRDTVPATLREAGLLAAGGVTPYALACLVYLVTGNFGRFWFWTFRYARTYATQGAWTSGREQLAVNGAALLESAPLLFGMAALGLTACAWCPAVRRRWRFLLPFAALGFLATFPGLVFRPHYFVLALPAAALLVGAAVRGALELLAPVHRPLRLGLPLALLAGATVQPLHAERQLLFELSPDQVTRAIYGMNPFPESPEIASLLRGRANSGDRVAVVGSEPQIYFYSGLRAATGFVYTYALMEEHEYALTMQRDFIREVETSEPRFLVLVGTGIWTSWLPRRGSHDQILRWFQEYRRRYDLIAAVDFFPDEIRYVTPDRIAQRKAPPGGTSIEIYERRDR